MYTCVYMYIYIYIIRILYIYIYNIIFIYICIADLSIADLSIEMEIFHRFLYVYQRLSLRNSGNSWTSLHPAPLRCRRFWSSISINWSRWSKPILTVDHRENAKTCWENIYGIIYTQYLYIHIYIYMGFIWPCTSDIVERSMLDI